MSEEFAQVVVVKDGHEYVAQTPAALINALYGQGYTVKEPDAPRPTTTEKSAPSKAAK
ncbi:hypothetical protein ACIBCN_18840 [Nocardia sp. NPDC051052]|uniref:hypothetical protein n=1 Tax=Nocardia sp. NPDC051052 TaxID=3364322 RepID=UPI0037AE8086